MAHQVQAIILPPVRSPAPLRSVGCMRGLGRTGQRQADGATPTQSGIIRALLAFYCRGGNRMVPPIHP